MQKLSVAFEPDSALPKYHQILSLLRGEIMSGAFEPDDQLPTAEALAELLGVTRFTVDRAINELARENLVDRVQGRGTFVRAPSVEIQAREMVGILMPTHGDLWADFSRSIAQGLSEQDQFCLLMDFSLPGDVPPPERLVQKTRKLIGGQPAYLLIHAVSRFPFELLTTYKGRLILFDRDESDRPLEADRVLSDYTTGGRMVAEHLLDMGHRRFVFVSPGVEPRHTASRHVLEGLRSALRNRQLDEDGIRQVNPADESAFNRVLDDTHGATAFVCFADYWATRIYAIAAERGISVPGDISVVGYFDTPHSRRVVPNLTSVNIGADRIAHAIVRTIVEDRSPGKLLIAPELVVRESCAPPRSNG